MRFVTVVDSADWNGPSCSWMNFPVEQRTMDMYKWIDSTPLQLVPAVPDNMNTLVAKGLNAAAAMHMGGGAATGEIWRWLDCETASPLS